MKNIFLIAACVAMCGTVAATPDCGVIAKSEIVIDVGHSDVLTAQVTVAPEYEFYIINTNEALTLAMPAEVCSGDEATDVAESWGVGWGEAVAHIDPGRYTDVRNSESYGDHAAYGIHVLNTDLSFRRARDGLTSCPAV